MKSLRGGDGGGNIIGNSCRAEIPCSRTKKRRWDVKCTCNINRRSDDGVTVTILTTPMSVTW